MIKLKDPRVMYDDKKDILYIWDGDKPITKIEYPIFNLDYIAQSIGCNIENSVSVNQNREIVKIPQSGVCRVSESVTEIDGMRIVWYRFAGEDYKITEAIADENGAYTEFKIDNAAFNTAEVVYFTSVKSECRLRDCLIDED